MDGVANRGDGVGGGDEDGDDGDDDSGVLTLAAMESLEQGASAWLGGGL